MYQIRRSAERGHQDHGWLNTYHTFSFDTYLDPQFMGFGPLRVMNEDRVRPGQGFPLHSHHNMEIISYVLEGQLAHRDSMGHETVLKAGEVQVMTAGRGIRHSEWNPHVTEGLHFMQIWILPQKVGLEPGYRQKDFGTALQSGELVLVVSPHGEAGSLAIHQDAALWIAQLPPGREAQRMVEPGRDTWVQVTRGVVDINGQALGAGDGVAWTSEPQITVVSHDDSEVLWFDLPSQGERGARV